MIHHPPYHGPSDPGDPTPWKTAPAEPCGAAAGIVVLWSISSALAGAGAVLAFLWARRR